MRHVGIIGGGQLGAFLCQAARKLGDITTVLAGSKDDVAIPYADHVLIGDCGDQALIDQLASTVDVITFEFENVPFESLKRLGGQVNAAVLPVPQTMLMLQNKALQKHWLLQHGFPTAHFRVFNQGLDAGSAYAEFGDEFVIKTQRGGYDGLGVCVVRNGMIPQAYEEVPVIVEAFQPHMTELAVLVARDQTGRCAAYPVFESEFDTRGNVLRHVMCPSPQPDAIRDKAVQLGIEVVRRLEGVGVFAVELFLRGNDMLINEISPRVHNVGHLTMEASNVCQFEQHIRAVTGRRVIPVTQTRPAVMANLLYEPSIDTAWQLERLPSDSTSDSAADSAPEGSAPKNDQLAVHWYGKKQPRKLRKMGHITAVADNLQLARQHCDAALQQLAETA